MQAEPELLGPLPYSPLWTWAGLALLLLVAAWYTFVFASTRPPRQKATAVPAPLTDLPALRAAYLQRITDVEQEASAGNVSARAAHQQISLLFRRFVRDATGVDAPRMTRADLARHPLASAAAAVGALYPGEFGPEPLPAVAVSAMMAREAVRTWS
ncbi:conserved hypothetical protein [Arthrobacter sp. 9AX]|uniref:hypothetical protein n=1 Tax=Arthrobacter sp. 9AX TaxID=2653131 RepID=UPI0012F40E26|nr:hypothetical protein [Arthrobacter sp. 9AX]VXB43404.1 conserved hypothetical protein [Arthrobacter sp. 9AX]